MAAPTLYTLSEAAQHLKVSTTWIRKRVSAQTIPHTRIGRHIRFTDEHLARIADAGSCDPATIAPIRRRSA